jgi:hypothetical protein
MEFNEFEIHAILDKFPSGRFGFVGFRIPGALLYTDAPEQIERCREAGCTQFLNTRVFVTQEEAAEALAAWLKANPAYTNVGAS